MQKISMRCLRKFTPSEVKRHFAHGNITCRCFNKIMMITKHKIGRQYTKKGSEERNGCSFDLDLLLSVQPVDYFKEITEY